MPLPIVSLSLPALNFDAISGYNVVCQSRPLPSPRAYLPPTPSRTAASAVQTHLAVSPAPLQTDTTERIITFSFILNVHCTDPNARRGLAAWQESHVIVTHVFTLLAHIPPLSDPTSSPLDEPITSFIPWSSWSSKTRLIEDRCRRNWYSHTDGHRFVKPTRRSHEDHRDPFWIQVLDFNPHTVQLQDDREMPDEEPETKKSKLVVAPSTVQSHVFQAEKVTTALPYVEVTSDNKLFDFLGLMTVRLLVSQNISIIAYGYAVRRPHIQHQGKIQRGLSSIALTDVHSLYVASRNWSGTGLGHILRMNESREDILPAPI